jgi:hypothetical protein
VCVKYLVKQVVFWKRSAHLDIYPHLPVMGGTKNEIISSY